MVNDSLNYRPITFPTEAIESFRRELSVLDEVTPFASAPELAERIASLGIAREVGTVNDELARFLFDADCGEPVLRESLHAELVEWNGRIGVHIWSSASPRLEARARWLPELTHPAFSTHPDGTLRGLFVFPALIAKIAALEGVELVLVKSWAMNSIFGGFDPAKAYYQTNFWELENNDSLAFADLVRHGRLAFLGTHDLIAHIAGVRRGDWVLLREQAATVHRAIRTYFESASRPTIASLILPYTIGVVLDDLAQPPTYGSVSHGFMLEALLEELARGRIPPNLPTVLTRFPPAFQAIIDASRTASLDAETARRLVTEMVNEIRTAMVAA